MELYKAAVVAGIAVGGIYALIAVGLTHSFKVNRVLNFAQAGFILWGAYFYSFFSVSHGWPVIPAAAASVLCVSAMGLLTEVVILRLAAQVSVPGKTILTFAILLFLTALAVKVFGSLPRNATPLFPVGGVKVIGTQVSWGQLANIGAALLVVAGIEAFLRFTKTGLLTRAVAEDGLMAEVLGARRRRIDALSWTMAAFTAGLAGVLIAPMAPFSSGDFLGYLVIALVATLLGGLQSLLLSGLGALAVGIIYTVVPVRFGQLGSGDLAVFIVVALLVLLKRRWPQDLAKPAWNRGSGDVSGSRLWMLPAGVTGAGWVALVVAAVVSVVWAQRASLILVYVIASLSLVPVVGWAGQLSLAQGGLLGIGAYATAEASNHYHLAFPLAVLVGIAAGVVAGGFIGLVTRKLSFVLTAVTTLAFSVAVTSWFLNDPHVFHTVGGQALISLPGYLSSDRDVFVGAMILVALTLLVLSSLQRSRWGVRFAAVKSAPVMAAHFGVSASRVRVYAFCVSGGLAATAGILYGALIQNLTTTDFSIGLSLEILLYAVGGGVTALYGPFASGLAFLGVPQALGLARYGASGWPDLLASVGAINLLSRNDDGLVTLMRPPPRRRRRRTGPDAIAAPVAGADSATVPTPGPDEDGRVAVRPGATEPASALPGPAAEA